MVASMSEAIIITPPPPKRPINWDRWAGVAALVVSLGAALFTGLQYRAASHQAAAAEDQVALAREARDEAKQATKDQADDVRRAREAAEKSADAAQKLASGTERSARAAETSASAGLDALQLNRRALLLSNMPSLQLFNSRLAKPVSLVDIVSVTTKIFNAGRGIAYRAEIQQWLNVAPARVFAYGALATPLSVTDIAPTSGNNTLDLGSKLTRLLTAVELKGIEEGRIYIYVYGRAVYHDNVLDKPRTYTWYFCDYYSPLDDGSDRLLLGVCPEHNYTTIE